MRDKAAAGGAARPRKRSGAILLLAGLLVAGCESAEGETGQGGRAAAEDPPAAFVSPVAGVARKIEPSVVQVNVSSIQTSPYGPREARGLGSGVIYREDGYIVTNNHVVAGADTVNVAFADGSVETGRVVGGDPYTDIAVVEVDRKNLPAAPFGDSGDLVVGQLAVAAGSPSGFQSTITSGVVSGLNREIPPEITGGSQQSALVDLIQTDAAISPGSSGGDLLAALRRYDPGDSVEITVAENGDAREFAVGLEERR